jgi:hypothetical protein
MFINMEKLGSTEQKTWDPILLEKDAVVFLMGDEKAISEEYLGRIREDNKSSGIKIDGIEVNSTEDLREYFAKNPNIRNLGVIFVITECSDIQREEFVDCIYANIKNKTLPSHDCRFSPIASRYDSNLDTVYLLIRSFKRGIKTRLDNFAVDNTSNI